MNHEERCRDAARKVIEGLGREEALRGRRHSGGGGVESEAFEWTIGGFLRCDGRVLSTTPTKIAVVFPGRPGCGAIFKIRDLVDEAPGRPASGPAQLGMFQEIES